MSDVPGGGGDKINPTELQFGITPESFQTLDQYLQAMVALKATVDQVSTGILKLEGGNDTFLQQIRAAQKTLAATIQAVAKGDVQSQVNKSQVTGDLSNRNFANERLGAQLDDNKVKSAEAYLKLQQQTAIVQEANTQRTREETLMTQQLVAARSALTKSSADLADALRRSHTEDAAAARTTQLQDKATLENLNNELRLRQQASRLRQSTAAEAGGVNSALEVQTEQQLQAALGGALTINKEITQQLVAQVNAAQRQYDLVVRTQQAKTGQPQDAQVQAYYSALEAGRKRDQSARETQSATERAAEFKALQDQATFKQKADADEALRQNKLIGAGQTYYRKLNDQQALDNNRGLGKTQAAQQRFRSTANDDEELRKNKDLGRQQANAAKLQADEDFRQNQQFRQQQEFRQSQQAAEDLRRNKALGKQQRDAQIAAQKEADANDPDKLKASADRTRSARNNILFGDGGASLALTQGGLAANYGLIGGVTSSITSALSFTVEFERSLKQLQAITGVTNTQMADLQSRIEGVSSATHFSATELAEASVLLGQAGLSTAEIGKALGAVSTLATATGSELSKSVDVVTSAMGAFHLSAGDTTDIANSITQALNLSKLDMDKFAQSLQYAGSTAAESGLQFNDLLGAVSVLSNSGVRSGSTLGTGLRQLLIELQKPTEGFKQSLQQLGLTSDDVDLKAKGLYGVLKTLEDAGFTSADALKSFEVRAAAAFNGIAGNLDSLKDFGSELNSTDAAARANAVQMDSLGSQMDRAKSQAQLLAAEGLKPLAAGAKELFTIVGNLLVSLRDLGPAIQVVGTLIGTAGLAASFAYAGRLIVGVVSAISTLTVSLEGLTAVALGGWIGAGIAIIGALGLAIYSLVKNNDDLKDSLEKSQTAVNNSKDAVNSSKDAYDSVSKSIETLRDRQKAMDSDSDLLKQGIADVSRQFDKYGETLDTSGIQKTQDLIDKLKELQTQMAGKYVLNLETAATQLKQQEILIQQQIDRQAKIFNPLEGSSKATDRVSTAVSTAVGAPTVIGTNQLPGGGTATGGAYLPGLRGEIPNAQQLSALTSYIQQASGVQGSGASIAAAIANAQDPSKINADTLQRGINDATKAQNSILQNEGTNPSDARKALDAAINETLDNIKASLGKQLALVQQENTIKSEAARKDQEARNAGLANSPVARAQGDRLQGIEDSVKSSLQLATNLGRGAKTLDDTFSLVLQRESQGGNQFDKNGNTLLGPLLKSGERAVGASQLLPSTARDAARLAGVDYDQDKLYNDRDYNLKLGKAYLGQQYSDFGGDSVLAMAAYNRGPNAIKNLLGGTTGGRSNDYRKDGAITQSEFIAQLPPETQRYVSGAAANGGDIATYQALRTDPRIKATIAALDKEIASKQQDLEGATTDNNEALAKLLNSQLSGLKSTRQMYDSKVDDVAKTAVPKLKEATQEEIGAIEKDRSAVEASLQNQNDPLVIKATGDRIKALVNQQYELARQKILIGKTAGKDGSFDEQTSRDLASNQQAQEAALAKVNEDITKSVNRAQAKIDASSFTAQMERLTSAFNSFLGGLTNNLKDINNQATVGLKRNGLQVSIDKQQAEKINDPNISAQYSSVDRKALSDKTYADEQAKLVLDRNTNQEKYNALLDVEATAKAKIAELDQQIVDLREARTKIDPNNTVALNENTTQTRRLESEKTTTEGFYEKAGNDSNSTKALLDEQNAKINTQAPATGTFMDRVNLANAQFLKSHDEVATAVEGYNNLLTTGTSAVGTFFDDIATGSKSAGQAFKDFATTMIKSIMQIIEQYLAMQAVKGILSLFGAVAGGTYGGSSAGSTFGAGSTMGGIQTAWGGGQVSPGGTIVHMMGGGEVPGNTTTRDSVNALLAPGEVVMNQDAVNAVGSDYLGDLNRQGNRTISKSTPAPAPKRDKPFQAHTNVYVVSPDQKPQMGPNDIVAIMSDDIVRGGQTKKLIKSVMTGQI